MKRILSLVLSLIMVLSALSVGVIAADVPQEILDAAGEDGLSAETYVTWFDEPVVTTVGTKADLLSTLGGKYTAKTTGSRGFAFIFKAEGVENGTVIGKFDMNVTLNRQTGIDETTGEPIYTTETKGPIWNGNWCNVDDYACNSYALSGDGYYIYWFPFRSIENSWNNVATEAGVTTLNSAFIFNQAGALGNGRAGQIVANPDQTIKCLGIIEGSIPEYDIYAYDKLTDSYTAVPSGVKVVAESGSNYAQWSYIKDLSLLFGIDFGANEGEIVTGWTDRDGNEIDTSEKPLLGVKVVKPVYAEYNVEDEITVSFVDADGEPYASVPGVKGMGLLGAVPAKVGKASDGVHDYTFKGWSVDGENVIDPVTYDYTGDVTFKPVFNVYGATFENYEPIELGNPADQVGLNLLPESVNILTNATGFTVVYKVEGADNAIIADDLMLATNGNGKPAWQWGDVLYGSDGYSANMLDLTNGYFFAYYNDNINGLNGKGHVSLDKYTIFNAHADHYYAPDIARSPVNENENATFQMLAVTNNNLQPTLTFLDEDGTYIGEYQHKYSDVNVNLGFGTKPNSRIQGNLLSAQEIFEVSDLVAPVKESDIPEVTYVVTDWKDADGNIVEGVYIDQTVYPVFEAVDLRTKYTVKFVNHDGTLLEEHVVPEAVVPAYEGFAPKKASTDTNSYTFIGWDKELAATPATPEADGGDGGEIVYTAQFEEHERRYDVIFYDEDGQTQVAEALGIKKGEGASTDVVPTKEADVQYTYEFDTWVAMDGSEVDLSNITADISVKASYKGILNKYTVTYVNDDMETVVGTEEVEYGAAAEGVTPEKEPAQWYTYEFDKWVDAEGNDADISLITGDVTVYASYTPVFTHNFKDVDLTRFYGAAVEYVVVNGIMEGTATDGSAFSPDANTSRAQLVTVLYRLEGQPSIDGMETIPFNDVPSGKYYTKAVTWAYNTKVVKGITETTFSPNENITREQFVTILYRYADEIKDYYVSSGKAGLTVFQDKNDIGKFAQTAVKWAIATENDMYAQGHTGYAKEAYITGVKGADGLTYMMPKSPTTRAQMATMLYRFISSEKLLKSEA